MSRTSSHWPTTLALLTLGGLALVTVTLHVGGDAYWWTLPLLYGPRWIWTPLLLGFVPLLVTRHLAGLVASMVGSLLLVIGILDIGLGLGRLTTPQGVPLRVLTFNAGGLGSNAATASPIVALLRSTAPEVASIIECRDGVEQAVRMALPEYAFQQSHGLCLISRYPILAWETAPPLTVDGPASSGSTTRATLQTPVGSLRVGLVHFATPRHALDSWFDLSRIPSLGPLTSAVIAQRRHESLIAREWLFRGEPLPTIVMGDFNLTAMGAIYREAWSDLINALSTHGVGMRSTKFTSRWGVRIDHILTTATIRPRAARVLPDQGSDHRPVLADLLLVTH